MSVRTTPTAVYWVLGHRVRPLPTSGDFGMVEIVSQPGVPGPPPHHHDDAAEFFYVAEGALDVQVDGEWTRLEAGESLTLEPGTVHTLTNRTDAPCRWITGWSPRGFERFFTDFGVPADRPDAQAASVAGEVVQRVVRDCADYGMVVGPPPGT